MTPEQLAANLAALAPGGAPPADGKPPATPAQGTAAPPTTPPPAAPVNPPVATVSAEQFATLQSQLADLQAKEATRQREAQEAQVKALEAEGKIRQAFDLQRQQSEAMLAAEKQQRAEVEARAKRYALDGELGRALASQPLVPGGAEQLTLLLRDHFVVEQAGSSFQVRTTDFRGVGDFIGAMLGRPEYAHFLRTQNPNGGTGAGSGSQSAPTGPTNTQPPAEPKNFSEAILMQHAASKAKGEVDPRLTTTVPFGLPAWKPQPQRGA
jgi:hypothetical protein